MLSSNRSNNKIFNTVQRLALLLISNKFNLIIFSSKSEIFSFCSREIYRGRSTFLNITRIRPIGLLQRYRFGGQTRINELFYLTTFSLQVNDDYPFMLISGLLKDNTAL
jgi:hypothetical protein